MTAGVYSLAALQIGAAQTALALTAIDNLEGMQSASLDVIFAYGSGGTSAFVVIQTTLDGVNWRDIARFDFTTASLVKTANLTANASKAIGTHGVLSSEGVIDNFFGNRLRAVLTSTGVYVNTALSVQVAVR